jgi:hypothetical protein
MWALRAAALGILLVAAPAYAQASPSTPPAEVRKEAARRYAEGTHAFDAGDFTRAGEAFDAAYRLAPHPDALWNAARAWHRAGELARAANLYARYLREAPRDAPDRPSALAAQKQLASKLGRIEIHAEDGVEDVRVDGVPVESPVLYVVPGVHALRGRSAQGEIERQVTLEAGGEVSVLVAPPPSPPPTAPSPPATTPPAAAQPAATPAIAAPSRHGWSPAVVWVEAGVTLAVVGVTLWSGLDTLSTLHTYDARPTQGTLDSGRSQEVRTNVLLGASIGLAAVTGLTALLLVDWRGPRGDAVVVRLGPGSVIVRGSF